MSQMANSCSRQMRTDMRMECSQRGWVPRSLLVLGAAILAGCSASVPSGLALTVRAQELPIVDGIAKQGFLT